MNPNYIYIFVTLFSTAAGQILMKIGANNFEIQLPKTPIEAIILVWKVLTNPYFFFGLSFAFLAAISWIFVLKKFDITFAYPFTALTLVLVLFISALMFKEPFGFYKILGSTLIISGILVMAKATS